MENQRSQRIPETDLEPLAAGGEADAPVLESEAVSPAMAQDSAPAAGLLPFGPRNQRAETPAILAAEPIAYDLGGELLVPEMRVPRTSRELALAKRVRIPLALRNSPPTRTAAPEVILRKRAASPSVFLPQLAAGNALDPAIRVFAGSTPLARLEAVEHRVEVRPAREQRHELCAWLPLSAPDEEVQSLAFIEPPWARLASLAPQAAVPALAPFASQTGAIGLGGQALPSPALDPVWRPAIVRQTVVPLAGRVEMAGMRPDPARWRTVPEAPWPLTGWFTGTAALPVRMARNGKAAGLRLAGAVLPAVCRIVERPREAAGPETRVECAPAMPPAPAGASADSACEPAWGRQKQIRPASPLKMVRTPDLLRRSIQTAVPFASKPAMPWMRRMPQPIEPADINAAAAETLASRRHAFSLASLLHAPVAVRLMLMVIPILLFLAARPASQPPVPGTVKAPVSSFVNARVEAVRAAIRSRAGIELIDDFRSGLDNWEGGSDLTSSWSYDQTGFVRPGPLALFRPSMGMVDYDLEFLGQIEQRAMGWVFRAEDLRNYHAARLVVLRGGPLPSIGLERYTVRNGKEGTHTTAPLPLNVRSDTVYRVRLEVRGPDFSLYVQNQLVQFWSDRRLAAGGIGFFGGRGEQSRIRWVQLSHQYDTIGRLCAYIAPMAVVTYNLQPAMGAATE